MKLKPLAISKAAKTLHLRNKLEPPGVWYFQSTYHFYGTPHVQSTDPSLMLAAGNAQHLCKSGLAQMVYEEQNRISAPNSRLWHSAQAERRWVETAKTTNQNSSLYYTGAFHPSTSYMVATLKKVKCISQGNNNVIRNILTRSTKTLSYSFLQIFRNPQTLDGMVNTRGCGRLEKPIYASCSLLKNSEISMI